MQTFEDSKKLAEAMVRTGEKFGVRTQAVVSDMCEPLGQFVGNSLEVYECIKILRGEGTPQMAATIDLSLELTARMLTLGGLSGSVDDAKSMAAKKLSNGDAIEKFRKNAECQGGDVSVFDDPDKLLNNDIEQFEVECETEGFVSSTDALAIGEAVVEIGGGRTRAGDNIDNAVGFRCNLKTGDAVQKGQSLGTAFCRDRAQFELVSEKLKNAYTISPESVTVTELVRAAIPCVLFNEIWRREIGLAYGKVQHLDAFCTQIRRKLGGDQRRGTLHRGYVFGNGEG